MSKSSSLLNPSTSAKGVSVPQGSISVPTLKPSKIGKTLKSSKPEGTTGKGKTYTFEASKGKTLTRAIPNPEDIAVSLSCVSANASDIMTTLDFFAFSVEHKFMTSQADFIGYKRCLDAASEKFPKVEAFQTRKTEWNKMDSVLKTSTVQRWKYAKKKFFGANESSEVKPINAGTILGLLETGLEQGFVFPEGMDLAGFVSALETLTARVEVEMGEE
jgi:hypothetical protein